MNSTVSVQEIVVPMAGIGIGKDSAVLRTLLGSCVGIAFYDSKLKLAALSHIVLPCSNGNVTMLGKYADTAIPETIRQLQVLAGARKLSLSVKIAGGANMFAIKSSLNLSASIGNQNCEAVERILGILQIPIIARDIGGTTGRKMVLNAGTGKVKIQVLGQIETEL